MGKGDASQDESKEDACWNHTDQRTWRLAIPNIIANISTPLVGLVDTAVVGHLPDETFLAGISMSTAIFNLTFFMFIFLRMGTTGQAAQAYGARDDLELKALAIRAIVCGLAIGLALVVAQPAVRYLGFLPLRGNAAVVAQAHLYFDVRIWGAPAALANYAVIGWLLGTQRSKTVLCIQVFLNLCNASLDVVFVVCLHWGVRGAALATVISNYAALALGLAQVPRSWAASQRPALQWLTTPRCPPLRAVQLLPALVGDARAAGSNGRGCRGARAGGSSNAQPCVCGAECGHRCCCCCRHRCWGRRRRCRHRRRQQPASVGARAGPPPPPHHARAQRQYPASLRLHHPGACVTLVPVALCAQLCVCARLCMYARL
jgi:hypothetical protein